MSRTVIVLAAGEGKRMKSDLPKVMHPLLGRSLVGHVLAAAEPLAAPETIVVVGHRADQVAAHIAEIAPSAKTVLQAEQNGTGHAVRLALPETATGTVIVLSGDVPLLRAETIADLVQAHEVSGADATLLTAQVPEPGGLGRIVRDERGELQRIVEVRDATESELAISEINAGVYAFDAGTLRSALSRLDRENDQGEEYLTDVFSLLVADGLRVGVRIAADHTETLGCNDRAELAGLRALLRDRVNDALMRSGVSIIDPATTWIDVTVAVARDVVIEPSTQLRGTTSVAASAVVGPEVTLIDTSVGTQAQVVRAHAVSAEIGASAAVGPYAYLRPGAVIGTRGKVGTFVEIKNASLGEGTKVPHLSYVGDATIGEYTNIGAGNLFANYSGSAKSHTTIGAHVKTACDTTFIAPVEIGDGAYTGAGSVITHNVPPGALGVARAVQRNIEGWVRRARAGSAAADAADRATKDQDS